MTFDYRLVDPTDKQVTESHVICQGRCPKCKVLWSERPDFSCDCFSPESQADRKQAWQMAVRQAVMEVVKSLDP